MTQVLAASRAPARPRALPVRAGLRALPGVALVVLGWFLLAPTAIGGPASYVVTDGTSMLPTFHGDGLVVTRARDSYHVGMVVAYHNQRLHSVVMHRVVARDGDRYVFKGDNNDFRDQYHPSRAELIGEEWIYLPGAGRYLRMTHDPLVFAGVIGVVTALALRSPRTPRRRRRHHG